MTRLLWAAMFAVLSSLTPAAHPTPPRALWVWDPSPLLDDVRERGVFLDFYERHRIGTVWAQISTGGTGAQRRLDRAAEWRVLLAEVHRRGMTLHALDGDPQYALRAQHDVALSMIDAVSAYNAAVPPLERFDGMHFDNEPYLLPEWMEPAARARLLADYLDLNERAAARSHAAGLAYGVDIPFWWRSADPTDRLLDIADNVGIMDYRNQAGGPDGIVAHAVDTLERTDQIAKARVFVGVETGGAAAGTPSKVTFAGTSIRDMNAELDTAEKALAGHRSYAGIAIHDYPAFRHLAESPK
ncbi:MAG TPA: hypothetical protein VKC35_07600 [Vicinamibacterales bacterium]|nr:hypothetical protein [Vicinamibacterales bacterium]